MKLKNLVEIGCVQMYKKQYSLSYFVVVTIILSVFTITAIFGRFIYVNNKEHILSTIKTSTKVTLQKLEKNIKPLVEEYSVSEYEKIIESELTRKYIYAITVNDYNMANLFNTQNYITGKIRDEDWNIVDFDVEDKKYTKKLDMSFCIENIDIYNDDKKLASVSVYSTDKFVFDELKDLVIETTIISLLVSSIFSLILLIMIKKIVIGPINEIVKYLSKISFDDILKDKLKNFKVKELSLLSSSINKMVNKIEHSNIEIKRNIAFLKSYELAMDESSIVSKSDLSGKIIYVNDNFCRVSGYKREEVIGKTHNILRHPDNPKEIFEELWKTIVNKKVWKNILKNRGKLGDYWVDISILPILDDSDKIVEYIAIRHDVTDMILQQKKLDNVANTDLLTGYGNRYKLIQDISKSIEPALAIINIDSFSQLNNLYGGDMGDLIIKEFSRIIHKHLHHEDYCLYHLQGDEYVIFNKDISKDKFTKSIKNLIDELKLEKIYIENKEFVLSSTISVSFANKNKILSTANMALKIAKNENKDFIIYNDYNSLDEEYKNNIKWTKKIKHAIDNDNFIPLFQPIVDNKDGKWKKYECLVRMKEDDKLVSPFFFLDISKKTKQYADITKSMLNKSFAYFEDKDIEFSVNITIEDILNIDIKNNIYLLLEKYEDCSRVVFEIVESESIENLKDVLEFIEHVKDFGCKIAIDDFGTGYSNFEYLVKLKVDYLKIDGSLIKNIDTDETSKVVVKNIVRFAHDLNIKTIAEFVENEYILEVVKELGIDYSQGYYFSEPKNEIGV